MEEVVVIGAGGHAKVVVATLLASGFTIKGIVDDSPQKWQTKLLDIPVIGPLELLSEENSPLAIIAIGDNEDRRAIAERFRNVCRWISVTHPRAFVHPSVVIGEGTVVFAGSVIQPDTVIGNHVIINTGATVDHDCTIGNFVHLAPGVHLAGGVIVGEGSFLGIGSAVIPRKRIGEWTRVGAGAVVIRDTPPHVTVAGVPAKPLQKEKS